jgi:beta-aspartyl-dipeptidase (metallo-type)
VARMDIGSPEAPAAVLRDLLARGQPLERVLPAFTSAPATLLRLAQKGRLAPGADADLVVLDQAGGPAEVMALGRWHVRGGQAVVRGMFDGPA